MKHWSLRYLLCVFAALIVLCVTAGCSDRPERRLSQAENLAFSKPEKTLSLLRELDYESLASDTLRARYILTRATANVGLSNSIITDTLLPKAVDIFKQSGDTARWVLAARLLSFYYYNAGEHDRITAPVDSLMAATTNPRMLWDLHCTRLELSWITQRFPDVLHDAEWLLRNTTKPEDQLKYATMRMVAIAFMGRTEEAVSIGDSILTSSYAPQPGTGEWGEFMCDYAEVLDMDGQPQQALRRLDEVQDVINSEGADARISLAEQYARISANAGDFEQSDRYLAILDSARTQLGNLEFTSGLNMLRMAITFKRTGHFPSADMHLLSKRLDFEFLRSSRSREQAMNTVMELDRRRSELTQSRQRLWLFILALSVLLIIVAGGAAWIVMRRRRSLAEAEERVEILTSMLNSVQKAHAEKVDASAKVKELVLRHLGVLKSFAGAPTAQNMEALRKLAAASDGKTLVDWKSLAGMIDELYDNFHARLMKHFPDTFNEKELRIILLMRAGFSTKEISVLTEQSSATIYVRKSSIRKKLSAPEGGDIIAVIEEATEGLENH